MNLIYSCRYQSVRRGGWYSVRAEIVATVSSFCRRSLLYRQNNHTNNALWLYFSAGALRKEIKETTRNEALLPDLTSIFFFSPPTLPRDDVQGNKAHSLRRELFCQKYLLFSIMWLFVLWGGGGGGRGEGRDSSAPNSP